jgi:mono/diheme cytochrome c family protein
VLAHPSMARHRHSQLTGPPGRRWATTCLAALWAVVSVGCSDSSTGSEPVARCFPSPDACPPAMFEGGLRAELGDAAAGARVYADNCARCHGPDGAGLGEARHIDMRSAAWQASLRDAGLVATVRAGRGAKMPAFDLGDDALRDLLAHLRSLSDEGGSP